MEQCTSCGAAMATGVEWCGQCYAVRGAAGVTQSGSFAAAVVPAAGSIMSPVRAAEKQAFVPLIGKTRWRKTPTTFGPLGRILCTLVLVVPLPVFIVIAVFSGGFEAGGAVIWGLIIMPLGLRDVWKTGTIPLN